MAEGWKIPINENPLGNAGEDDDSDWEYEYHETETETFYLTLDLSSFTNSFRPRQQKLNPNPPINSTTTSTSKSVPLPVEEESREASSSKSANSQRKPIQNSGDSLQILDFHTPNPLITYQSRLYSCSWSTNLGTNLLFANSTPKTSLLLAATRIQLSARPVRLVQNHRASKPYKPPRGENPVVQTQKKKELVNDETKELAENPSDQAPTPGVRKIPLEKHPTMGRRNQARFLERLMAAKEANGERDKVTIIAKRRFTGTGWRARRKITGWQPRKGIEEGEDEAEGDGTAPLGEEKDDDKGDDEDVDVNVNVNVDVNVVVNANVSVDVNVDFDDDDEDDDEDEDDGEDTGDHDGFDPAVPKAMRGRRRRPTREAGGLFRDYRFIPRSGGGSLFRKFDKLSPSPRPRQLDSMVAVTPNNVTIPGEHEGEGNSSNNSTTTEGQSPGYDIRMEDA